MHVAFRYSLGEESNFLASSIVPPAVRSASASVLAGFAWAASLLASLPPSVLRRSCPTQQGPSRNLPVWRCLVVLPQLGVTALMQVADVESLQRCLVRAVENDRCEAVVHLSAQPDMAGGGKQRGNGFRGGRNVHYPR